MILNHIFKFFMLLFIYLTSQDHATEAIKQTLKQRSTILNVKKPILLSQNVVDPSAPAAPSPAPSDPKASSAKPEEKDEAGKPAAEPAPE